MLEHGVAIAVGELGSLEDGLAPVGSIQADHAGDYVFRLNAVGSDILHSRGAHLAWDEREVLRAPQTHLTTTGHKVVEHNSGTHGHEHLVEPHIHELHVLYRRVQHGAREVPGEQKIAARAYMHDRLRKFFPLQVLEFLYRVIFDIQRATDLHSEGVVAGQVVILNPFHRTQIYEKTGHPERTPRLISIENRFTSSLPSS